MTGTDFMDEIDCGSFFDQIDDFIDFPTDSIDNGSLNCNDFSAMWSDDSPVDETDAILSGEHIQLDWLSNFFEDSSVNVKDDGFNNNYPIRKESPHNPFNSSSPISVLESSSSSTATITTSNSSSSGGKTQRGPRSKRPRPVTFTPRSDNFAESRVLIPGDDDDDDEPEKKIKKIKKSPFSSSPANQLAVVRKCMHCEITKTPQWRMGPMGPKTLCNACGVRFKSGRLFPEYRPAASPTFVPALHSNSHKKVIEMRTVAPTA